MKCLFSIFVIADGIFITCKFVWQFAKFAVLITIVKYYLSLLVKGPWWSIQSRKDDDKFPIFLFIHLKQQIFGEVGEAGADWDIFQISCVCFYGMSSR